MSLTVPEGQEPARNSIPGTGLGWHPAAPDNVGTRLNGLAMTNPIPNTPGVRTVEYADEDYATSHSSPVVTGLNFVPCTGLPVPEAIAPDIARADEAAALAQRISRQYDQCYSTPNDGVIATKGEIIFAHNPAESLLRQPSEFERKTLMRFTPHTYDYNAETTQGITLAQLNDYFDLFAVNPRNRARAKQFDENKREAGTFPVMSWDTQTLSNTLCFEFSLVGLVDAVGPGQSTRTDRVNKNYICIAQRVAHEITDVWHAALPALGRANQPELRRGFRHKNHRPGALLYLLALGTCVDDQRARVHSVRIAPAVFMNQREFIRALMEYGRAVTGEVTLVHAWFVGTYRSPSGAFSGTPGTAAVDYVGGNASMQRCVPQCEISVLL